jgi:hypothetical protein
MVVLQSRHTAGHTNLIDLYERCKLLRARQLVRSEDPVVGNSALVSVSNELGRCIMQDLVEDDFPADAPKSVYEKRIAEDQARRRSSVIDTLCVAGKWERVARELDPNGFWRKIFNNAPAHLQPFMSRGVLGSLHGFIARTCALCAGSASQCHVLNRCQVALAQGRYTWRHDSVLFHLTQWVTKRLGMVGLDKDGWQVLSDAPPRGYAHLPSAMGNTGCRPDMVLWRNIRGLKEVLFVELTVPLEENLGNAHQWKSRKYTVGDGETPLVAVVEQCGWRVNLYCVEVSSLGLVPQAHFAPVIEFFLRTGSREAQKLYRELAEISIRCSHVLWEARRRTVWDPRPVMTLRGAALGPVWWTPSGSVDVRGLRPYRELLQE